MNFKKWKKLILINGYSKFLADPITKQKKELSDFKILGDTIDARIFLKNTRGFNDWSEGQKEFEELESSFFYYKSLV